MTQEKAVNTKVVHLKLSNPRTSLFVNAVITAVEDGWSRLADPAKVHTGSPLRILLQKEVPVDSFWPQETSWNCHADSFPTEPVDDTELWENGELGASVGHTVVSDVQITGIDPIIQAVIDIPVDLSSEEAMNELADLTEELGLDEPMDNPLIKPEDNTSASDPEQPLDVVSSDIVNKTSDGFEQRPYTSEELQDWNWANLTKLGASVKAEKGKKPELIAAIVKLSQEQWGSV